MIAKRIGRALALSTGFRRALGAPAAFAAGSPRFAGFQ